MKTLILMRHAKSSWDAPLLDKARSLNKRGRQAAAALGDWLRAQHLIPDEILCSGAARTIETTDRLNLNRPYTPIDALYLAPPHILMHHLEQATGDTVLMVAHNPGIAEFAHTLTHTPPNHPRFDDYPTGSTTVLTCKSWQGITDQSGQVTHFLTPHDL